MAAPNKNPAPNSNISTTQPISLIGTMSLMQNPQQIQNMSLLQKQHIAAAFQNQQRASPQQLVTSVRPVVNVVGNQPTVATLQNIQVLGRQQENFPRTMTFRSTGGHHQDGIGNVPINIITTGGQTFAVASNLQGGIPAQNTQMQIRSIAPNAATVVSQLQVNNLAAQQIRAQNAAIAAAQQQANVAKTVQQVNLTLPIQTTINTASSTAAAASTAASTSTNTTHSQVLTKRKLQDLLHEIDPTETIDDDVEEILLHIADDFIENVIGASCQLAKHRRSNTLDVKDVQLHLDRNWNMWIPGYGSEDLRPYKKLPSTEAHRQRLALIKKAMKK